MNFTLLLALHDSAESLVVFSCFYQASFSDNEIMHTILQYCFSGTQADIVKFLEINHSI